MSNKHKHAELIHAWADGSEIEIKTANGLWVDVETPTWDEGFEYRIKKPEPEWVDAIPPQGVLCWVSNNDESDRTTLKVVHDYSALRAVYKYKASDSGWRFATPLTNDEIRQYLRSESEPRNIDLAKDLGTLRQNLFDNGRAGDSAVISAAIARLLE